MTDNPLVRGRYRSTYRDGEGVIFGKAALEHPVYNTVNRQRNKLSSTTNRVIRPITNAL